MGKDKYTFRKIEEAKRESAEVTNAIETIANVFFDTESEKTVFFIMIATQLDSIIEQAHFFGELLNTYKKEDK